MMTRKILIIFLTFYICSCKKLYVETHVVRKEGLNPKDVADVIQNKEAAINYAEIVWTQIISDDSFINKLRPYNIELLKDSIWIIEGNIDDKTGNVKDGSAYIEIQKRDGKVLVVVING